MTITMYHSEENVMLYCQPCYVNDKYLIFWTNRKYILRVSRACAISSEYI